MLTNNPENLITLFEKSVAAHPHKIVYKFLLSDDKHTAVTYEELYLQVLFRAGCLQEMNIRPGQRALILYPPGLDYITTFYACIYAGVIAVPAYPPDSRNSDRIAAIIRDCDPAVVLTTPQNVQQLDHFFSQQSISVSVVTLPDMGAEGSHAMYHCPGCSATDVAFLQYTSGSTSNPKGVVLTHGNLVANSHAIRSSLNTRTEMELVSWLPPYHDMGLIGSIIHPCATGMTSTLMSPLHFIKKPLRWLKAISDITTSDAIICPAPNFGYELCAEKVTEEEAAGLQLGKWESALCGAEPVRAGTYERFCERFHISGFKRSSFIPVYGLAESTLLVSGTVAANRNPVVHRLDAAALKIHRAAVSTAADAIHMVGCGAVAALHEVRIVDPVTLAPCQDKEVGEIWVRGKSVASGYWQQEGTAAFNGVTTDGEGPFLRTGDMGFMDGTELFITGRLKDCLVINGKNHYPQDIEQTVSQVDPMLRKDSTAVFLATLPGSLLQTEEVIVVQEVVRIKDPAMDYSMLLKKIRRAVFDMHGISAGEVMLIEQSSIPKTSSGKIMRHKARALYLEQQLKTVCSSRVLNPFSS